MVKTKNYLAVDLGASSGRVLAGSFDGERLQLEQIHRFDNGPIQAAGHLHWDILQLWSHILSGLRIAGTRLGGSQITSVGVDTWGVDFALLGRGDELLGNPYHYRDARTAGMFQRAFQIADREEIFSQTGVQFMELNTLYQLLSMQLSGSPLLDAAESFLMMPDVFHWLLTGEQVNEFTNATTTQLFNPSKRAWSTGLLERMGLPTHIFHEAVAPGSQLGSLRREIANETGLTRARVTLPGTHDTASAVMAVPAGNPSGPSPDWCYISSGTWSLMGVEIPDPLINDPCQKFNFTNEGGVGDTIRLLKNIAGLWLIQECRRIWIQQGNKDDWDWQRIVESASDAPALKFQINPDHDSFVSPPNMVDAICDFCRNSGQGIPNSEGAIIRCALESLALRYREVLETLESLIGSTIQTIHIVGGGTQNELLCQMTADACNRQVLAGPVEATAIGNVMMQSLADGDVASITQARELIRKSFPLRQYEPREPARWDEAFHRYQTLVKNN